LLLTAGSYPKGGTFTTKLDLKNQCLINHKTVSGKRNPAFWVGAVIASAYFICHCFVLNDLITKYVNGIKIIPIVRGKNQTPSPSATPFAF
jgi:hypothetical protein